MTMKAELRVSMCYAALFAAVGSFFPFITLYLQNSGWSGTQIGVYAAIGPSIALLVQPLWGLVGDAMGDTRRLFAILMTATATSAFLFGFVPVSAAFYGLAVLLGVFQAPLNPIMDSLAVATLGEGRQSIGRNRLWGSVFFAIVSLLVGSLFDSAPRSIFFIHAVLGMLVIAAVWALPRVDDARGLSRSFDPTGLRRVLTRKMLAFLAAVFVMQLGHTTALNFLSVVMSQRGASSSFVGYAWSLTALIEIPVFLITPWLLQRFGPAKLLMFSSFFSAARIFLFNSVSSEIGMVVTHSLDGFAFPLMLVSAILIVFDLVPDDLKTTGQTTYAAIGMTLPRLLGSLIGGRILDVAGTSTLYIVCGIVTLLGATGLLWWQMTTDGTNPRETAG